MIMDILLILLFATLLGQGEPNNCSVNFCQKCVIQGPINCTITNGAITCLQPQDSSRCSQASPNCHTNHVSNPNDFRPNLCYILLSVNQSQFSFLSSDTCGKEENGTCYTDTKIPVASTKECEISLNEDPRMLDPQTYRCNCNTDNCNSQIVIHYPSTTPVTSPTQASPPVTSPTQASPLLQYVSIGLVIPIVILLLVVVGLCVCGALKKRRTHSPDWRDVQRRLSHRQQDEDTYLPIQLVRTIGRGKFGSVWKAVYQDGYVAVKIFTPNHHHFWEKEKDMYSRDSTAHINVLRYIGSECRGSGYNSQLFMITEYCPLGSLNQFLKHRELEWMEALTIMTTVVSGLSHLHSNCYTTSDGFLVEKYSVAHRDIKSANVLVKDEYGHCVIGDLGMALTLDPSADERFLANSGQVGTYRYMAPEALDAKVDLRDMESFKQIDIYAVSLVLWETMTRCRVGNCPVPEYRLPYTDIVGERPTLDAMKDVVVVRKCRPPFFDHWKQHEGLKAITETLIESWDEDPEARLSAANILNRLEALADTKPCFDNESLANNETESQSHRLPEAQSFPTIEDGLHTSVHFHPKLHSSFSYSGQSRHRYHTCLTARHSMDNSACGGYRARRAPIDSTTGQQERSHNNTNSWQQASSEDHFFLLAQQGEEDSTDTTTHSTSTTTVLTNTLNTSNMAATNTTQSTNGQEANICMTTVPSAENHNDSNESSGNTDNGQEMNSNV